MIFNVMANDIANVRIVEEGEGEQEIPPPKFQTKILLNINTKYPIKFQTTLQ